MIKRLGMALLVACCAAMMCAAVSGCADNKQNFVGTWSLESGSNQMLDESTIELMSSLGYAVTIDLAEDGTGSISMAGTNYDLTWEAKDASQGTVEITKGISGTLKLSDDKLVLEDDTGANLVFAKAQASSSKSSASAA